VRGNEFAPGERHAFVEGRNFDTFRYVGLHVKDNLSVVMSSFRMPMLCALLMVLDGVAGGRDAEAEALCCEGALGE
jgi:hypothetical protein